MTVTGESGAGKTLLLRSLADLDPHEGELRLRDKSATEFSPCEWRRRVAYVANESFWWCARVGDHFARTPAEVLIDLGLGKDIVNRPVEHLSAGEKQRLGLLRALLPGPDVLLLDEPTSNLDGKTTRAVEDMVKRACRDQEIAAVWISHDLAQVARVSDRRYQLTAGRLETAGGAVGT